MKTVYILLLILIIVGVAICITFIVLLQNKKERLVDETVIKINNVDFTLNDIKQVFLQSDFAIENKCDGQVYDAGIKIICNKKNYDFVFNDYELQISTDESGKDVYKYLVNSVEELFGYKKDEFIDTLDRYLNGEIYVQGLNYKKNANEYMFGVDVTQKLNKYVEINKIEKETIKDISDINYEFEQLDYKISNIEVIKDDYINFLTFSAIIGGQKNYNANFTINYYDIDDNLVATKTVNLNDYDTFGYPYLGLVINIELNNDIEFNKVSKYSFYLSEGGKWWKKELLVQLSD